MIDPRVGVHEPAADVDRQVGELAAALARIDGVRVAVASGSPSAWTSASASSPGQRPGRMS